MFYDSSLSRRSGNSALIAAILAAIAPITVAVHGLVAKDREMTLAMQEQAFRTQSWFLASAVDPEKTPELRQQVLRFIVASKGDSHLIVWATAELAKVDTLVSEREAEKAELAKLNTRMGDLGSQLETARRQGQATEEQVKTLQEERERTAQEIKEVQRQLGEQQPQPPGLRIPGSPF